MKKTLLNITLFVLVIFLSNCSGFSKSGANSKQNNQIEKKYSTKTPVQSNDAEHSDYIIGKVIGIIDGDTYDLLINENQTVRIRMEGIDAPEKGMPYYQVAKKHLSDLCCNKELIFVQTQKSDSNNRLIGFSYLDTGVELSHEMVKVGLAWHFKKFNNDEDLADLELDAKKNKRGLWQNDDPMSPWENRKLHRQGKSTKELFKYLDGM